MGQLLYGGSSAYEIDDRALAHLMVVITSKLRRQERFLVNWEPETSLGPGRISIWISPNIPLDFRFSGSRPAELNRRWLEALERSSVGVRGLVLMPEADAEHYLDLAGRSNAP